MSELADLLAAARRQRVCSAAAWSVGTAEGVLDRGFTGTRSWGGPPVTGSESWDLASLTKPLVAIAALALVERGALRLDGTVADYLPDYRGGDKAGVTVHQLLTHTSGIAGGVPLYREHPTRERLLAALRLLPPRTAPDQRVEYSSQGFIVLGLIVEAAGGKPLDVLVRELVCEPAGLRDTGFNPGAGSEAVATEHCAWRRRVVVGEVHDENALVLGGVAGHAGMFSTLADVERLGRLLLAGSPGLLEPATHTLMTSCHTDGFELRRCMGWQAKDPVGCPAGDLLGPDSFGHTGFTGTSLWGDPALGRYFVLLTNRVHPSREHPGIDRLRVLFHDLAVRLRRSPQFV